MLLFLLLILTAINSYKKGNKLGVDLSKILSKDLVMADLVLFQSEN